MKFATCLVTALVLLCSTAVFAEVTTKNRINVNDLEASKAGSVTGINNPTPNQGGEDIGTAVSIPALPYSDAGNTCSNIDNYDEVCPFSDSTSPDVVYSYAAGSDIALDISLCESGYDTKLYVYENSAATLVACNDDACGSDGFRSELLCVPMTAGNTYYVVVDGYFGACGDYALEVSECTPCTADCPGGSQIEGEPVCFDDYKDAYNGGCNSTPNVFSSIACDQTGSATMCGEYGGFFHGPSGFNYRDTDWYELDSGGVIPGTTSFEAAGVYESLFGYLDATLGCFAPVFEDFLVVGPCDPANIVINAPNVWIYAGTSGFGAAAGPCGGDYTITVDNYTCGPVSVEEASWGSIKDKYSQR